MQTQEQRLTINEVINLDNEEEEFAHDLLRDDEETCFKLRNTIEQRIQRGKPLYGCSYCRQPVKVGTRNLYGRGHSFHFRHLYKSGDCPVKTDSSYTKDEIRCMKYNGAKESLEHLTLKLYIAERLRLDSRFTKVKVESVIKGSGIYKGWKKPDISATYCGRLVVFEIQLSTTFLDVIVSREVFYRNEGASIFWIFKDLNPNTARSTEKDVFFNNKSNALSINDESIAITSKEQDLTFIGHYKSSGYDHKSDTIIDSWKSTTVTFDQIKFDKETLKPFFISFDENYINAKKEQYAAKYQAPLRQFESIILQDSPTYPDRKACAATLCTLHLYDNEDIDTAVINFSKALLSVRDGKIYFPNQAGKWNWLVNYVWQHHMKYWLVFLYTVNECHKTNLVFDPSNVKLNRKREDFKKEWRHNVKYSQDSTYYPLFSALIPKIEQCLIDLESHPFI